jgi:hypothetical protein
MGLRDLVYRLYERRLVASLSPSVAPRHVGVMCDGNRRWARSAGLLDVSSGHSRPRGEPCCESGEATLGNGHGERPELCRATALRKSKYGNCKKKPSATKRVTQVACGHVTSIRPFWWRNAIIPSADWECSKVRAMELNVSNTRRSVQKLVVSQQQVPKEFLQTPSFGEYAGAIVLTVF